MQTTRATQRRTLDNGQLLLLAVCVVLELLARWNRLPLFPIWVPLFVWAADRRPLPMPIFVVTALGALGFALWFLREGAVGFYVAMLAGLFLSRPWAGGRVGRRFLFYGTGVWLVAAWLTVQFPPGPLSFDLFFAAVFMQLVPNEYVVSILSKALLLGLAYAGYVLARLMLRRRHGVVAGAALVPLLAGMVFTGCGEQPGAPDWAFAPAALGPEEAALTWFAPEDTPQPVDRGHVVLPADQRDNAACIECHAATIAATSRPATEKGHHEVHFSAGVELNCAGCHVRAGEPGFPDLTGRGDRRTAYNGICVECHAIGSAGAERWAWAPRQE